jgi:hypothetical protein
MRPLGGKRYYLILVDEATRYTTTFPLRNKSDAPIKVLEYLQKLRTIHKFVPAFVKSDNAAEFCSKDLGKELVKNGIRRDLARHEITKEMDLWKDIFGHSMMAFEQSLMMRPAS